MASGSIGGPANLASGPVNFYSPAYGGIPSMPNPTATAGSANAGNAANLPGLEGTAGNLNTFNQGQLLGQYNMAIPNYAALTQTASGNTMQNLQGKVPQDVINLLTQQAAERGITTGMPAGGAGGNSNAAYLRALGLTSLGQEQTGMSNLHQLSADAPVAKPFDPASMFVTPEQQQEAQYMANVLGAAPQPAAAAQAATAAATVPSANPNMPWWARAAGMPTNLGPGSYLQGTTWHTPAAA